MRRPAVVLADAERGDWILCQVTSKSYSDTRAVELTDTDFAQGSLRLVSYARPAKLFTAHESLFVVEAGVLSAESLKRITDEVVSVIQRNAWPLMISKAANSPSRRRYSPMAASFSAH